MKNVNSHLSLLGKRVKDRVSGLTGIVDSVTFDLYGCVQAMLNSGFNENGTIKDRYWFDVSRLEIINDKPVMDQPNFDYGPVAEGKHGPAHKPGMRA